MQPGRTITFSRCPAKTRHKRRWASSHLFEWLLLPPLLPTLQPPPTDAADSAASDTADAPDAAAAPPPTALVRLVPKAAPHLCLTATALIAHDSASGASSGVASPAGATFTGGPGPAAVATKDSLLSRRATPRAKQERRHRVRGQAYLYEGGA